ncbi:hypothetical protein A8B82_14615 [Sulfitobacter sp. EhC04]|uniref:nuclear transport factor 2 family protein n=1 Tax=Sulfitobacter sp. EhC04 TaxID=1849168 RepID=UPI0007F4F54C|nr:nuclear transport factor 2 family protein [Sulfitobacter sp. EhC04]OAN76944.1 hypothetical protein A8B82_14615 [Sulfitobacter sp. EhC04]
MTPLASSIEIAQLIQKWGLCRDQGRWDDLKATFTPDGTIFVTWFRGRFADFVEASKKMYVPTSPRVKHLIGLPVIKVQSDRAVAETNVQILGRFAAAGTDVDYTSYARFLDRLVRTQDGWRIMERTAIYEKDRLDPVVPSSAFDAFMTETDFSTVPEPYRYLGYRLISAGRPLQDGILCDGSPQARAAISSADIWLSNGDGTDDS